MFSKSKGHVLLSNTKTKASINDNKMELLFLSAFVLVLILNIRIEYMI